MRQIYCLSFAFFLISFFSKLSYSNSADLQQPQESSSDAENKDFIITSKYGDLKFSGYFQPQFQWIESKGAPSFGGGDFEPNSNNRFKIRRGRLKAEYSNKNSKGEEVSYFVLQFDGNEKGVSIRDFWGRYSENKWKLFHVKIGMMPRPFGDEIQRSSSIRESPERGRMSQIIMNSERDLGFSLTFNPRAESSQWKWLAIEAGVYNGQGISGPIEYDSYKDFIGRISAKNLSFFNQKAIFSFGASILWGHIDSPTDSIYILKNQKMVLDDSGNSSPAIKRYFGLDAQLLIPNKVGNTQFRAEYIRGTQTANANSSVTPRSIYHSGTKQPYPLYSRQFDGAYFYFIQHLNSWNHQVVVKYDWYNPQRLVNGMELSQDNGFSMADVAYHTLGLGYIYHINTQLKVTLYYDRIWNEKTGIINASQDFKDDLLTCRLQFKF